MTKVLLIRHGYSKANELNLFLGYGNMDLTEIGLNQANCTANYLKDIDIDVIYSSDLDRTIQTATPTAKIKNLPVLTDRGLREIYAGKWEYMPFTEIKEKYLEDWNNFCFGTTNGRCTGGESFLETRRRIYNTILYLAKKHENKTIAIFTHATSIKGFTTKILNLSPIDTVKYPLPSNASVSTFSFEKGKFSLLEYSKDDFMDVKTSLQKFSK